MDKRSIVIVAQKKEVKQADNKLLRLQRERNKDIGNYGLLAADKYAKIFERIKPSMGSQDLGRGHQRVPRARRCVGLRRSSRHHLTRRLTTKIMTPKVSNKTAASTSSRYFILTRNQLSGGGSGSNLGDHSMIGLP